MFVCFLAIITTQLLLIVLRSGALCLEKGTMPRSVQSPYNTRGNEELLK